MDAAAGPRAWFRLVWLAALVSLLLGLLALGPGLGRGFLLSYDMVAVPRQPFTAAIFGWGGALPRAVPSDAVAAAAARVLPADIVQKLFLLAIFVLAAPGWPPCWPASTGWPGWPARSATRGTRTSPSGSSSASGRCCSATPGCPGCWPR